MPLWAPINRLLVVSYSQSGQTARAADTVVTAIAAANPGVQVDRVDLCKVMPVAARYPLPWSIFRFVRAQPEAFFATAEQSFASALDFTPYDAIVIAYPVWFLAPAVPVTAWLLGLPPASLAGKPVLTLSTCRKMWYRAQTIVRSLVEARGGSVVSHISLQEQSGNFASLVMTPRFFLTSRKSYESSTLKRLFPSFGIRDGQYAELAAWLTETARKGFSQIPSYYRFTPGIVLAEIIGVRISRSLHLFWFLAQRLGGMAEKAYLLGVASATVVAIALLMPLMLLLGLLPPLRGRLRRLERNIISPPRPEQRA